MKREKFDYPAGQVQGHVLERLFPGIGPIGEQIHPGLGLDGPSIGESVDIGEPNLARPSATAAQDGRWDCPRARWCSTR